MKAWAWIAASLCSLAHAAWNDQFAGLWLNGLTPGWGISVHQQGERAIATVLTYGNNGEARWYQAREIIMPPWDPYILWGTVVVGGDLYEGGSSRKAGRITFTFDEETASVAYEIDGARHYYDIARFDFSHPAFNGNFVGAQRLAASATCSAPAPMVSRMSVSSNPDSTVRLSFGIGDAICVAQGRYQRIDNTPLIVGQAACSGIPGLSDPEFYAADLRISRDTVTFNASLAEGSCHYYGPVVATRIDAARPDGDPPHDDVSGLWTTDRGWAVTSHLQGNTLFAMVLLADGRWQVAPDAAYSQGQDGDFVMYAGDLWSVRKTPPGERGFHAELEGRLQFSVDAAGYSSANTGADSARIARLAWPREDRIAGSYAGVRSRLLPAVPVAIVADLEITQDIGAIRIRLTQGVDDFCDITGALEWHGLTAAISGNAACMDGGYGYTQSFQASDLRVTDQGLTMRYWLGTNYGYIAALRK